MFVCRLYYVSVCEREREIETERDTHRESTRESDEVQYRARESERAAKESEGESETDRHTDRQTDIGRERARESRREHESQKAQRERSRARARAREHACGYMCTAIYGLLLHLPVPISEMNDHMQIPLVHLAFPVLPPALGKFDSRRRRRRIAGFSATRAIIACASPQLQRCCARRAECGRVRRAFVKILPIPVRSC